MTDSKRINWEAIIALGTIVTIVGTNYLFTENAIKKFEHRMEFTERRMEIMDERWVALLNELHSQDKRLCSLESKVKK